MATLRDILNEQKWRHASLDDVAVTVVHRGAPGDVRVIGGEDIVEISATGLWVSAWRDGDGWENEVVDDESDTAFIPYHRIVRVQSTRELLWEKAC